MEVLEVLEVIPEQEEWVVQEELRVMEDREGWELGSLDGSTARDIIIRAVIVGLIVVILTLTSGPTNSQAMKTRMNHVAKEGKVTQDFQEQMEAMVTVEILEKKGQMVKMEIMVWTLDFVS